MSLCDVRHSGSTQDTHVSDRKARPTGFGKRLHAPLVRFVSSDGALSSNCQNRDLIAFVSLFHDPLETTDSSSRFPAAFRREWAVPKFRTVH